MSEPKPPVSSTEWYEQVEAEAQREFEERWRQEKASEMRGSVASVGKRD